MTDSTDCMAGGPCSSSLHGGIPVPLGNPHDAAVSHHGCSRASSPWRRASWRCAYAPSKGRHSAWQRFFVNCLDPRELLNKLVEHSSDNYFSGACRIGRSRAVATVITAFQIAPCIASARRGKQMRTNIPATSHGVISSVIEPLSSLVYISSSQRVGHWSFSNTYATVSPVDTPVL